VEKIICCGDIANGETLGILAAEFAGEIFLVRGNMEIYGEEEVKNYKNINYGGRFGFFAIAGRRVGACHEPDFIGDVLKEISRHPSSPFPPGRDRKGESIIFYGHTHKPWIETKNGVQIVNPGTLGGVFYQPTFAVWDAASGKLELKLLNDLR
jgi:predicted phosphodiesterase